MEPLLAVRRSSDPFPKSSASLAMRALAAHLPNARFDEFQSSAHCIHSAQPDKFVRDVTTFLKSAN